MGDRMRPISFEGLMKRAMREYAEQGSVFGVHGIYRHEGGKSLPIFGETIETPFGPAAGPHTQLSQNIIAAYAGGCRYFELKTVQTLDGEDLPVSKPCILARDEGFNVEWSTELTVKDAMCEYIKAWFALKLLSRELGLGGENGFVFNMSVGYDLNGIKSEKIDSFIESLKDAGGTECFRRCAEWAIGNLSRFKNVDKAYVRGISPRVCRSITLSTLHGCPPDEIERIATYLIGEKGLNTYVKCNPTLLGYEFARKTLDSMGYSELSFDEHHFNDDLQFADAVPMFARLKALAEARGLEFGLKLTNTFPVMITRGELPGGEMYMSGKGLYPLTAALVEKLSRAFDGGLRVSFSGGADEFNIGALYDCGVWSITLATTLLKPGGYERIRPIAKLLAEKDYKAFKHVDVSAASALAKAALTDRHHIKPLKPASILGAKGRAPISDCFVAPCTLECPIHQDITEYLDLAEKGEYAKALEVICRKNPLPFMTGTLCPHRCQAGCVRGYYEDSIHIREVKLLCAQKGSEGFMPALKAGARRNERIAVVGGGPGGMAAAFFAARAGAQATIFEKRDRLGGVPRYVIPSFRISDGAIDGDAAMLAALGVQVRLNAEVKSVEALYDEGFTHVALAVGACSPVRVALEAGSGVDALSFLADIKRDPLAYGDARNIVIIGGGNTAMDAARTAMRIKSASAVTLAYRRTKREMPAEGEEIELAIAEGVRVMELRNPKRLENGELTLEIMKLGERDESGRRKPVPTGDTQSLPCDLLVLAAGAGADKAFLERNGVKPAAHGDKPGSKQSDRLWLIGDALHGAATIVEAIASARAAVDEMLGMDCIGAAAGERASTGEVKSSGDCASAHGACVPLSPAAKARFIANRGELRECGELAREAERCRHCGELCECCAEVCPNRANIAIDADGRAQIIHIDAMCNECGNCAAFCPHGGAPYRDKLTVFALRKDFDESENEGFLPLNDKRALVRAGGAVYEDDSGFTHTAKPYDGLMRAAWTLALELR